jgi:hypothetical protein
MGAMAAIASCMELLKDKDKDTRSLLEIYLIKVYITEKPYIVSIPRVIVINTIIV